MPKPSQSTTLHHNIVLICLEINPTFCEFPMLYCILLSFCHALNLCFEEMLKIIMLIIIKSVLNRAAATTDIKGSIDSIYPASTFLTSYEPPVFMSEDDDLMNDGSTGSLASRLDSYDCRNDLVS